VRRRKQQDGERTKRSERRREVKKEKMGKICKQGNF
jgi:hypothetical protein